MVGTTAWLICLLPLVVLFLVVAFRTRPALGIGIAVAISVMTPSWIQWQLFTLPDASIVGTGVDIKVALASIALLCYSFLPRATFPVRLSLIDGFMITLITVHLASDFINTGPSIVTILRACAEWYVPYLCGRLAFQFRNDLRNLWPVIALVSVLLAMLSIFEAITRINPYEVVFGLRPEEQTPREAVRWGLRRAYGPCLNPIYFGLLQLLLMGWTFQAAHRALRREAKSVWLIAPVISVLGILSTCSRGPILGLFLFLLSVLFIRIPRARWPMVGMAALTLILIFAQRDRVLGMLESWSGEADRIKDRTVIVNQTQEMQFSGTRSRLIMLNMYRVALFRSGLLGYGTDAVTGFPIKVPVGPQDLETLRRIRYIDNEYVLLTLRFGYLGVLAFLAAGIAACWKLVRLYDDFAEENLGLMLCYVAAVLMSTLVVILTVWMPHDYGFFLLWTMGAASGLVVAESYGNLRDRRRQRSRTSSSSRSSSEETSLRPSFASRSAASEEAERTSGTGRRSRSSRSSSSESRSSSRGSGSSSSRRSHRSREDDRDKYEDDDDDDDEYDDDVYDDDE